MVGPNKDRAFIPESKLFQPRIISQPPPYFHFRFRCGGLPNATRLESMGKVDICVWQVAIPEPEVEIWRCRRAYKTDAMILKHEDIIF